MPVRYCLDALKLLAGNEVQLTGVEMYSRHSCMATTIFKRHASQQKRSVAEEEEEIHYVHTASKSL